MSSNYSLEQIDPATVIIGTNVRLDARLDKAFIASVRERGVLVPVVVHRDEEGRHVVLYGQRRTLAAVAANRESIPAYIVDTPAEADRLVDQIAENEHRAGLSTTERVKAYEQLAALGISAAQIAKRTATAKADVTAALTVASSDLATAAAQRWDFLTLEQAATLADFQDDGEAVQALTTAAKRGQFEHTAQRLRDERDEARDLAQFSAALTEQGITVIERPAWDNKTVKALDRLEHDGQRLTPETHAACPGHAAYVDLDWEWADDEDEDEQGEQRRRVLQEQYVCTDWAGHGHTDRWASSTPARKKAAEMSEQEREAAAAQRRDVIASNKAWDSAEPVRRGPGPARRAHPVVGHRRQPGHRRGLPSRRPDRGSRPRGRGNLE